MIGGGKTSADRVAFLNSALSRYLDFMDSYRAKKETNHPSDNMGGAFSDIAHENNAYVSSGGWIETVLRSGNDAVDQYLQEAKEVGFDVIEISTGFIMLTTSGLQRLVEKVV